MLETPIGFILVDYQSYAGDNNNITDSTNEYYAGKHASQLDAYTRMIEKLTVNHVLHKLIYYVILRKVVEIE